jgi:hypothetical protein
VKFCHQKIYCQQHARTMTIIQMISKSSDRGSPRNRRTIMLGTTFGKLRDFALQTLISWWVRGRVRFKEVIPTLIHIFRAANITPRGRANSLCKKRLEILTCDWPKGSNRSQPLYTWRPGWFGSMISLIKICTLWHGPSSLNLVHLNWRANSCPRGHCHISLQKPS